MGGSLRSHLQKGKEGEEEWGSVVIERVFFKCQEDRNKEAEEGRNREVEEEHRSQEDRDEEGEGECRS